jgi:hypothetical protein
MKPGGASERPCHAMMAPYPLGMTFRAMKSARLTTAAQVLRGIGAEITLTGIHGIAFALRDGGNIEAG